MWMTLVFAYVRTHAVDNNTFLDAFSFFTGPDPTHGYVKFVSRDEALSSSLLSLSDCGFYSKEDNSRFTRKMDYAFQGRLQWCAGERNEGTADIERWARSAGRDGYQETVKRFNVRAMLELD